MRTTTAPLLAPLLACSLIVWTLSGCGDDDKTVTTPTPTEDAGSDTADTSPDAAPEDTAPDAPPEDTGDDTADTAPDPCEGTIDPTSPGLCPTPQQDGIPADGQDVLGPLEAGAVRVGRVQSGTGGLGGIEATCKRDDFVLVNAVARFCVDGMISSNQLFFDGGRLIDAEPVGPALPEGATGLDRLFVLSPFVNFQVGAAQRIEIVRDGSDGELAVLRVSGPIEPSSYLAGVAGPVLFQATGMVAATEYRLRPNSPTLEIVTTVRNEGTASQNVSAGDIPFWGDTSFYVYPGNGTVTPPGAQAIVGYGDGVAYGLLYEDRTYGGSIPEVDLPATPTTLASVIVRSGESLTYRRHFVVAPHVAQVLDAIPDAVPGHPLARPMTAGQVRVRRGGQPLAGARLELYPIVGEDLGRMWYGDYTGQDGTAPLRLEAGTYRLLASDPEGHQTSVDIDAASASDVTIDLAEGGVVELNITRVMTVEGSTTPEASPAKVFFWNAQGGERLHFVLRGTDTVRLPAGTWNWEASLGMEYTAVSGEVTVTDGGTHPVAAELEHVVPTPGFAAGEFHQHMTASLDSDVQVADRLRSNLGEGVDFAVSSDHDIATDFQPVIDALGVQDLIASLSGTEVSPTYGHFGAYPVAADPFKPSRGALVLSYHKDDGTVGRYEDGASLIAAMRTLLGAQLIQMNHPRDSTGYYDSFAFDRTMAATEARRGFSLDADTMEVINGPECPQILDWFALFNQGFRIVGVGNSDTHSLGKPPGYPRNYIPSTAARPQDLSHQAIIDGVKSGDVVISAAAWIEFGPGAPDDPDAVRPGRLHTAASTTIDVRVLTPPWAEVNHLAVVRNGLIVETLDIGGGPEAIVDFDGPITLETDGTDAWFAFLAWGDTRASAVYRGRQVFAIANPFFLDADGDGSFTAPGPGPIEGTGIFLCE